MCLEAARRAHPAQCGPDLDLTPINSYDDGANDTVQEREDAVALVGGSCTGTLIEAAAGPVVLTAGHCVGPDDQPVVAFNVEADPDGDDLVTDGTVLERSDEPDYALLQLAELPDVVPTPMTREPTDELAIIQHARGAPKTIAEGTLLGSCDGFLYYADLDTLVGSSGAGVLTSHGHLVGLHIDGDCTEHGRGMNRGLLATEVVQASSYLEPSDLADR